ncbi:MULTISPECIES: class I fructose-bisphosphate aldolase [unclassified Curtobacterium]|uniref:class I fructose-bisphosphate aldolase n=1 Tax=unclassified Curtobacterium TaxID=257496 RepID=UPI0008DD5228|nr:MULTISPECIES: deoxyribose-phosphate aldolase [unclassified Curtobacterium]OIH96761.1 deoxyribose-phosphate aldolase [Curtobacterium sp. MCBA15_003]OII13803.1 deoxyribose-phosphate aldolase [Curtobacterium sp. MCBA15_009]OII29176.1 deoxyribose-phosphate aldolase [Curtobacterium sp. MMLR14_006]
MPEISTADFARLRDVRAGQPELVRAVLDARRKRSLLADDGKLFIVAADHPARGALAVRDDESAMADRYDLLERLVTALGRPGVDGVLGTPDVLEDLALLGALDDKVVVGSMNRGGLRGATFEMDDRYTAYSAQAIKDSGLDFAKLLVRIALDDPHTAPTLEATARAVSEAAALRLPIMLEPFMSAWQDGRVVNDLTADAVITSMAIAAGLGESSAYSWLKIPVVDDMERVMAATTLPTLLLGGDPSSRPLETYGRWADALALPGVRGLVVGRTLLYPPDGDVAAAVDVAAGLVHTQEARAGSSTGTHDPAARLHGTTTMDSSVPEGSNA